MQFLSFSLDLWSWATLAKPLYVSFWLSFLFAFIVPFQSFLNLLRLFIKSNRTKCPFFSEVYPFLVFEKSMLKDPMSFLLFHSLIYLLGFMLSDMFLQVHSLLWKFKFSLHLLWVFKLSILKFISLAFLKQLFSYQSLFTLYDHHTLHYA